MHEGAWCVSESERQHQKLEMPIARAESGLRNIFGLDANLVVTAAKIDLAEILSTLQTVKQLIDPRQWITILDRDVVECSIVHTHAHCAVLFLDEQDRSTERRLTTVSYTHLRAHETDSYLVCRL